MYTTLILSTLTAITFASPIIKLEAVDPSIVPTLKPADGSNTICDTSSDKIIGLSAGPELDVMLNNACAAMMNPCAYRERLPAGTVCVQTTTWPLSGPVKTTQSANVESTEGTEQKGYKVQFAVTPAKQPQGSAGVFWSKDECFGYFAHMLEKHDSEGGCITDKGLGVGKIMAGGDTVLKDTVFEVTIVPAK